MDLQLTPFGKEIVAGLTTGSITTVVTHPLDLVKIRLQLLATNSGHLGYGYVISSLKQNAKGNIRQLIKEAYRGLGINWFGNATAWALYFGLYRASKDLVYELQAQENSRHDDRLRRDAELSSWMYLSAGAISGVITSIATNPIWVIKTRMMSTSGQETNSYTSAADGIRRLVRDEGIGGLWRGLMPSLFGVSQGAIYFMIYDTLKHRFSSLSRDTEDPDRRKTLKNSETFVISSISKVVSVTAVYPFQLLKSNLQSFDAEKKQYTFRNLVRSISQAEGLPGFYKGLSANLLRAIPSTCITFLLYENVKSFI
ncbi:hypothetical protein HG536_0B02850 [Torulaspora globosa]|uniref:Uncharacterized protein n=1 Tax=Torulaspora globosa TaxID=48254 RepID=A0A7G3ZD36_9SACH|nr:uncharacterized protein HG536_0B02850 [Torulaspora globosa]QLL31422.1 hypothetical protein HG536_0B02850 [Torulaspora globosa]